MLELTGGSMSRNFVQRPHSSVFPLEPMPDYVLRTHRRFQAAPGAHVVVTIDSAAREGRGYILQTGDEIRIEPEQIHVARAAGDPAWIEVHSEPAWAPDDHFSL